MDLQEQLVAAVKQGLSQAVRDRLTSAYGDPPFAKVLQDIVAQQVPEMRTMLTAAVTDAIADPEFRDELRLALRASLAKLLVSRFGGELEKQVNALKSDPATRARITLAIEQICNPIGA
jgi:hypothetical protein